MQGGQETLADSDFQWPDHKRCPTLKDVSFSYGSVIVVSLMLRTLPLWVLLFAFIFNREYESFSRRVLFGNGLLMVGTILVIIS